VQIAMETPARAAAARNSKRLVFMILLLNNENAESSRS
jgi:hypothetical protein